MLPGRAQRAGSEGEITNARFPLRRFAGNARQQTRASRENPHQPRAYGVDDELVPGVWPLPLPPPALTFWYAVGLGLVVPAGGFEPFGL